MRVVIADASPINYLVLIGMVDLLERLFGHTIVPSEVFAALTDLRAPAPVAQWMRNRPDWVQVRLVKPDPGASLEGLGAGERAGITLALQQPGALLLIDEALGRSKAAQLGITVTGTIGILDLAHEQGLIDRRDAMRRLLATNFRVSKALLRDLE